MKRLILFFFFLLPFVTSYAQDCVVKGQIIDKQSKETLPGASVALSGTTQGTITGFDGTFKLSIKTGSQKLAITYIGYIDQQIDVNATGTEMDLGVIELESNVIGLGEMLVIASFARDRQTPVAVSRIEPKLIEEKLGSKEFPEILKTTPSVYATKAGGGFGDSRINLRGFESNNIGVLINGIPVNDMESGRVYWSNWAGLSDVTRTMQVQRGLGASKLALSSVGGTINIITKSTDAQKGGTVYYGIGNDNYKKTSFTISTGLLENGWAVTASGARTAADGYVKGTNYEAWSYFLNVSKRLSKTQQISYTVFGAPQWHNQRYYKHYIQDYRKLDDGTKYNGDFGYLNGDIYSIQYNAYHKPQMSLNHSWQIDQKSTLTTAVYASFGRGGGRRIRGTDANWLQYQSNGKPYETTQLTGDGYLNWAAVLDSNRKSLTGSRAVVQMDMNSHDWYGILSNYNTTLGKLNITAGIDGRYYLGYHYSEITDLLGGKYYTDVIPNVNRPIGTPLQVGDHVNRDYTGQVFWGGLFGQAEYVDANYSAFVSAAVSNTQYTRYDYFLYTPEQGQKSDAKNFLGYSFKGGFNYNLSKQHNVYVNGGYFLRAPFFSFVYKNYTNVINDGVKPERVLSFEAGYGFRSAFVSGDISLYRTAWMDKGLTRAVGNDVANITGLNALHQGIEITTSINPIKKLDINVMASIGDWRWDKNVIAEIYNADNVYQRTDSVFSKGVHVGDAAQTTASLTVNYEILPRLKIGIDYSYTANLYAYFDITTRSTSKDEGKDAWKMPSYHLIDLNIKYGFKMGKMDASLYTNLDNILNTEYVADANDGANHDALTSTVYYGFGRTWTIGLRVNF